MHPKLLFNTYGPNHIIAVVDTNRGDKGAYVLGFLDAAHHLASQLEAREVSPDIVIYGALYLYRHGLELGLKALLGTYHYELEREDKAFEGHDLNELWKVLKPYLELDDPDPLVFAEYHRHFQNDAIEYIEECVKVIHGIDPDGQRIRYGEDLNGDITMRDVHTVNIEVLRDMCEGTQEWMLSVLEHRLSVDNYLRHSRGYFDNRPEPRKKLSMTPIEGELPGGPVQPNEPVVLSVAFRPWEIFGPGWPKEMAALALSAKLYFREKHSTYIATTTFTSGSSTGNGPAYMVQFPKNEYDKDEDKKPFKRLLKGELLAYKGT